MRIIEAKDLAGVSLDPWVNLELAGLKKNTTVKKQTNNPSWDEVCEFFSNFFIDLKLLSLASN